MMEMGLGFGERVVLWSEGAGSRVGRGKGGGDEGRLVSKECGTAKQLTCIKMCTEGAVQRIGPS